jgi:asparagine synthase (glutamine-hydrolysing)
MNFIILPDSPVAGTIAQRDNCWSVSRVITHGSGRPWVVGRWADEDMHVVTAGARRLAILGPTKVDAHALTRELGRARSVGDLDAIACDIPGSVHVIASFDGRTRSRGALSTARQVFYATVDGTTIAADSPRPLAAFCGARLDREILALRLLVPAVPWPLSLRPIWHGIRVLAVGHWLDIGPEGSFTTTRWWEPPPADKRLTGTAPELQRTLLDALTARLEHRDVISSDLSGGLDSTSLCFLATSVGADLVTHHRMPRDQANDDTVWAQRAAGYLPGARHRILRTWESASWYENFGDQGTSRDDAEGPGAWNRNRAYLERLAEADVAEGVNLHLLGLGGDELFSSLPAYLWSLVRAHPLRSLSAVNKRRAANRWSIASTIRGLADRSSFGRSLVSAANELTAPAESPSYAPLGWGGGTRMPPWATRDAVAMVRRLLREVADEDPRPLCSDHVRHQMMEFAIYSGSTIRQMNLAFARSGVEWSAPYLDDRVIDAVLAVRVEDRAAWGKYKPVLTAAMRGQVPDEILQRRTKGEYSAEEYNGLLRNRQPLLEMCDDLQLSRLGLVDAAPLRAALGSLSPDTQQLTPLQTTLACESWLRSPSAAAPRSAFPVGEAR